MARTKVTKHRELPEWLFILLHRERQQRIKETLMYDKSQYISAKEVPIILIMIV